MAAHEPLHEELRPFRVEIRPHRERVYVIPSGELDMSVTGVLEREVREVAGRGFEEVVLDLRELGFMDSTGLRLVLDFQNELGAERFALIDGSPAVARLLELTGMREHLRFVKPSSN